MSVGVAVYVRELGGDSVPHVRAPGDVREVALLGLADTLYVRGTELEASKHALVERDL